MVLACALGFYYFTKIVLPLEAPMMLDVVLLSICLIGPIGLDMFSLVAVISGNRDNLKGWGVTIGLPIVDILQCTTQVCFKAVSLPPFISVFF